LLTGHSSGKRTCARLTMAPPIEVRGRIEVAADEDGTPLVASGDSTVM